MGIKTEQHLRPIDVIVSATCDHCGRVWYTNMIGNLDGGMEVTVSGWYGGTIDPIMETVSMVLCDECARNFMAHYFPDYDLTPVA
jgi:hypothetical protein